MKLYLDICCYNRPYDDQSQLKIKLETEAKLSIQELIKSGIFELVWSYILDFENEQNPFIEKKSEIEKWKSIARTNIVENERVLQRMEELEKMGFKPLDSLHISCAIHASCDYFLTVDAGILKNSKLIKEVIIGHF
ncbi:MAG: PIN domain protein [Spirochaetes bacterium GWF1_49_6]|nr:MAG: PIN domain protein [Spirochaetes bacterium GWF1_49_6]